jgi:hypothetical protein
MLKTRFWLHYSLDDSWRVGKGIAKLALIDKSRAFHKIEWDKAKSFVKAEVGVTIPKKARLIQGNQTEITAYEHPWEYKAMGEALKEPLEFEEGGIQFCLYYAGGMNHDSLSDTFSDEWHKMGRHSLLDERDGKNWDSTMQVETLTKELELYRYIGLDASKAYQARSRKTTGKVYAKLFLKFLCVVKYVTIWKRLSGDWNTSIGNTLISMMIAIHSLAHLPDDLKPVRVVAYFMGDDYLGLYDFPHAVDKKTLAEALTSLESDWGITPERGITNEPLKVSFISLGLWPRRCGGYQFVPHPARQMVKMFAAVKPVPQQLIDDYISGIAMAFWPVYWGWPMMMTFLKRHYVKPQTKMPFDAYFADMLTRRARDVDWVQGFVVKYQLPFTATHFKFGDASMQRHPVVDAMLAFETADPVDRM